MKRLITSADFVDFYFHAKWTHFSKVLRMLHLSNKKRILNRWNTGYQLPINWYDIPMVLNRINFKISGYENIEYSQFILDKYFKDQTGLKLISPGCGGGEKEMRFARFPQFQQIDGFDIAPNRIQTAQKRALEFNLKNTNFFVADIDILDKTDEKYDVFLFDSCLHHFENLPTLMKSVKRCLKDNGLLVILEYTGPNRYQYSDFNIKKANEALKIIPKKYRVYFQSSLVKSSIQAPGFIRMYLSDPSEGVQAGHIIPSIEQEFDAVNEVKIGGDLLAPVLKGIAHHFIDNPDAIPVLEELFAFEDAYLKTIPVANYTFGVYKPKVLETGGSRIS